MARGGKWARIAEPPAGARWRGYRRFSGRDREDPRTTFAVQAREMERFAQAHGWTFVGYDDEPNLSGALEEVEDRPAFARHLADAAAGRFDVSLVAWSDRWARDTAVGLSALKRLRRAGVYWATADGRWTINATLDDGHAIAFVVDAEVNAAYARKASEKAVAARAERAAAGHHNGRLTWGYARPPLPPRPSDAAWTWRPPRWAPVPHPRDFARLQTLGEWAAAGASDLEIARRAAAAGWELEHPGRGSVPWTKSFVASLLTAPFPRESAPGSGRGTVRTPSGELVEGRHPAAWAFDLARRIDEGRVARRKGSRGRAPSSPERARVFSGLAVCAECGRALHHQWRPSAAGGYAVYLCGATDEGRVCPLRTGAGYGEAGWRSIRADALAAMVADALLGRRLPADWRERVAAGLARASGAAAAAEARERRAAIARERERVLFQHRVGAIGDDELREHAVRLRTALALAPDPDALEAAGRASMAAGETLERWRDYWDAATPTRRTEFARLVLAPSGLRVDLRRGALAGLRVRDEFLPALRLALPPGWAVGADGWLTPPSGGEEAGAASATGT